MTEEEDAIRLRAYWLWEQEGRPQGRHDDHWKRACHELGVAAKVERGTDVTALKGKASRPKKDNGRTKGTTGRPKTATTTHEGAPSGDR